MPILYSREDRLASIAVSPEADGMTFTAHTRRELNSALERYRDDDDAWIAVIHCTGPDYCPGSEAATSDAANRERLLLWAGGYLEVWKPTIAAVQGKCGGEGLALALGCDLRVADATTRLSFGTQPGEPNVTQIWLTNLVGASLALELTLCDRTLGPEEAQRWGLINRVVTKGPLPSTDIEVGRFPMLPLRSTIEAPNGDAYSGAMHFALELLQYAPVTRNFQKETAYQSIGVPFFHAQTLELGPNPYASEDRIEGGRAFVENRRPVWRNR